MKKLLLLILILPLFVYGQAVNETFSNFVPDTLADGTTEGMWVFDDQFHGDTTLTDDFSSNGYDFTKYGFSVGYVDELTSGSNIYSGGNFLTCDGSSEYFSGTSFTNVNPNTDDYSLEFFIRFNPWNSGVSENFYTIGTGTTDRILFYKQTGSQLKILANDGADAGNIAQTSAMTDSEWKHVVITMDVSNTVAFIYINGDSVATTVTTVPNGDANVTATLWFPSIYGPNPSLCDISYSAIHHSVLTPQQVKERWGLARGWYSNAGKVYRDSWAFNQGFYDSETVFYPLANTNASWSLTFNAWGGKSGDVVTVNVGDQSGVAQTLTASSVEYTLDLGYEVTSADSLYFVASAGDTVYIDNVVLTADTTPNIYVSDQGNDSNLGTSVTQAYLTLAKAYGLTLAAGSTVYLFSGDEWRETWTQGVSGSSGNQTTLTKVDSATGLTGSSAVGADPIVNGADLVNTWVDGSSSTELITNGTFDSNTSDWTGSSGTLSHESGSVGGRTNTAKLIATGTSNVWYEQTGISLPEGIECTLKFRYYIPSTNTKVNSLLARQGPGTYLWIDETISGTDSWGQVDTTFTPPASNTDLLIYMANSGNRSDVTIGDSTYIDSVSITQPGAQGLYYSLGMSIEPNQVWINGTLAIFASNSANVDADSAAFWTTAGSDTLFIYTATASDTSNIEASQREPAIDINNKSYITIDNLTVTKSNEDGIKIIGGGDNFIISNCTLQYNYWNGVWVVAIGASQDNGRITANTANYNGEAGIKITYDYDNLRIDNNIVHNNGTVSSDASPFTFTGGITLWGNKVGGTNATIESNTVYNNGVYTQDGNRGNGIWLDELLAQPGNIVRYNTIYENNGRGLYLEWADSTKAYYNIIYGHDHTSWVSSIQISRSNDVEVYNNTCYDDNVGLGVESLDDAGTTTVNNNLIKNNIFLTSAQRPAQLQYGGENDGTDGTGNIYTYNTFGADGDWAAGINWGADAFPATYVVWEDSLGYESHSVESDPLFTDAASNDFTLLITPVISPAIDAGTDVSLVLDYAGNVVPVNARGGNTGPQDIGAYEYQFRIPGTDYQKRHKRLSDYWRYKRY